MTAATAANVGEGLLPARITVGEGPLIAAAIHDGHAVRSDVLGCMALPEEGRLREEDPFTARWAEVAPTRIIGLVSRFELDLNRPRDGAVYLSPEQSWGLKVWAVPPAEDCVRRSLQAYDAFYTAVRKLLDEKIRRHGRIVVYDLHSYNHRRDGADLPPADVEANPEINVGTGTLLDRRPWDTLIGRFLDDFRRQRRPSGATYDVRENVKFQGGQFGRWIHQTYPGRACALSIEMKKFFMDEWSGQPIEPEIEAVHRALAATVPGVLEELSRIPKD